MVNLFFILQSSSQARKPSSESASSRKAAQKTVLGWFSNLRGRATSFLKRLLS